MSIQRLTAIVSPPDDPVDSGSYDDWSNVEARLGIGLPTDYKLLVNRYGSGRFGRDTSRRFGAYVYVLNPFGTGEFGGFRNLLNVQEKLLDDYRAGQAEAPEFMPKFAAFPPLGGLLPWATGDNGGIFCWLTEGEPDSWPTICLDDKWTEDTERFDLNATAFLASWLSGEIEPASLEPGTFPLTDSSKFFVPCKPGLPPWKW